MSGYLSTNLNALGTRFGGFPSSEVSGGPAPDLSIALSRTGDPVPKLNREGRDFPFHSLFDPRKEGTKLIKNYGEYGFKVFYGLAGAYQIRPFLGKSKILIIEPEAPMLRTLLTQMDFTELFADERLYLLCRPDGNTLSQWLKSLYIPLLDGTLQVIPHRFYMENETFLPCENTIITALEDVSSDCSTQKRLGRQWQRNILNSLDRVIRSPFDPAWFGEYEEVILTAAGPGLEKEMDRLANLPAGTLLVSVDTALPALQKRGITPDGVVTIDPQAIGYQHFMKALPPSCRIIADWGAPVPPSVQGSRTFWFCSPHPLCRYFKHRGNLPLLEIETGGNVTQAALALLRTGFPAKITLLGADFSYPEGKPYSRGSYFHTWFAAKSSRTSSLENGLLQFVLERSVLKGRGGPWAYTSPLLEQYEKVLQDYVKSLEGSIEKKGHGKWEIRWRRASSPALLSVESSTAYALLNGYAEELEGIIRRENLLHSPLLPTLIPLAYSFYEKDGDEALRKSLDFTLNNIKKRNSLKKTYTSP